ncbi:hypothetical protein [Paraburkholderia kururiensis]|uniref:Uncharacterized protein n=1 Tax=Paraburkholderia kururiensis TaxID=984307 RepID=A0ABZ0WNR9_9BURK|nr:hypothetical protein [Paraburkholderia kururiensis]WQD79034.1 hypothetical protein U0042_04825 [Paraburkholderia kururiensis]
MRTQDFTDAIGRQADSDAVKNLLHKFGIDRRIVISGSETDTYENVNDAGVSLLFESERYISAKHGVELPSDAPVLTAIFLYGAGDDEFSEYNGDLPGGLLFSDGREAAIKKLGNSAKFNPDRNSEFWEMPGNIRLFVRYSDDRKSIERIQFGIVWR